MTAMPLAALLACSPAGADPAASAASRPTGWKQLPSIAAAVAAAAADRASGITVDVADAWGDPAAGCYGVWLELHGGTAAAPAIADQILDSLARASGPQPTVAAGSSNAPGPQPLAIDEVVKPTSPEGVLAFRFARPPYRGRLRAQLGAGRGAAVACFGNPREPIACEAVCRRVLGATVEAPR